LWARVYLMLDRTRQCYGRTLDDYNPRASLQHHKAKKV